MIDPFNTEPPESLRCARRLQQQSARKQKRMHRKQYRWPQAADAVNVEVVCRYLNGRRSGARNQLQTTGRGTRLTPFENTP